MRWKDINTQTCSIARSITVFGDKWTMLILREIFLKQRRFSDIQKKLGISKHRLSDRLNHLIEHEVLYKKEYDSAHHRFEYRLTEKGVDLYPVIIAITQWGDKWESDEDGVPVEHFHDGCGEHAKPVFSCSVCNETMHARNTTVKPGPGLLKKIERGEAPDIDLTPYEQKPLEK